MGGVGAVSFTCLMAIQNQGHTSLLCALAAQGYCCKEAPKEVRRQTLGSLLLQRAELAASMGPAHPESTAKAQAPLYSSSTRGSDLRAQLPFPASAGFFMNKTPMARGLSWRPGCFPLILDSSF